MGCVRRRQDFAAWRLRCCLRRHAVQPALQLALEPSVLLVQRRQQLLWVATSTRSSTGPTPALRLARRIRRRHPRSRGPPTNPDQGTGAQAIGNLTGWDSTNPNLATLTGIVFPEGIRDPYVYNYYLGVQREIMPKLIVEANYVGTAGHKLFRAQNVNRIAGERLPEGTCATDNFGRRLCSQVSTPSIAPGNAVGRLNPNFGTLRVWQNVVNSNYNALQLSREEANQPRHDVQRELHMEPRHR